MRYEFRLPDIGEGVREGEIVAWLVAQGQQVAEDQPMVEVMTDKATVILAAPRAGAVLEVNGAVGETVNVGSVLVVLDVAGAGASEGPPATACGDLREDLPGTSLVVSRPDAPIAEAPTGSGGESGYFNAKPLATPATRKLARDLAVDLRRVAPTGSGGRVTSDDVRAAHEHGTSAAEGPAQDAPKPLSPESLFGPGPERDAGDERIPLRGLRRRAFDAMARSARTVAHSTFVEECNVTALKAIRERLRPRAAEQGVKLSFLPFIAKATLAALKRFPVLNATLDEATETLLIRRAYHLGIATATEAGLVVPVIRNADGLSILQIGRAVETLAELARHQKLSPAQVKGSTFTITSLGQLGGLLATPIVHHPEAAILGVHRIRQRPVVKDGAIVVGDVLNLSLSFDHRLIDGHTAAAFVYDIVACLEEPESLLLDLV